MWGGFVGSVLVYGGLLQFGVVGGPSSGDSPPEGLALPLGAAGFVLAAASAAVGIVVRNVRDASGRRKSPSWAFPAFIVALALAEAPGIFGFVLGVMGYGPRDYFPLFLLARLALSFSRPGVFFPRLEES